MCKAELTIDVAIDGERAPIGNLAKLLLNRTASQGLAQALPITASMPLRQMPVGRIVRRFAFRAWSAFHFGPFR